MMGILIVIALIALLCLLMAVVEAVWGMRCDVCGAKMIYEYDEVNDRGVYTCPVCGEIRYVYY